jgi:hypothetical protein
VATVVAALQTGPAGKLGEAALIMGICVAGIVSLFMFLAAMWNYFRCFGLAVDACKAAQARMAPDQSLPRAVG